MTPRTQTLLSLIAAQLEIARADRVLKECACAVSVPTVYRVLHGADHKISTLADIADALECDLEIRIVKRPAA